MRLPELTIELGKVPDELIAYLLGIAAELDLTNERSLTQEHAFYNAVFRYDAVTDFFTPENYFGSHIPPMEELTPKLQPLYDWLISTHLPNHTIFRSQIIMSPPGSVVLPHIDPRLYHELSSRIHIVMKTNSRCRSVHFLPWDNYRIEYYHMREGYAFNLDNLVPHAAFNLGSENRLHAILDIMPTEHVNLHGRRWMADTNFTMDSTRDQYKSHVRAIEQLYGGNDGLKQIYNDFTSKLAPQ